MEFNFSRKNLPKQLFINGKYVESKNLKKLTLHNPKDDSLVADDVAFAGEEDVDTAVAAAEKAFVTWKKVAPKARRNIIEKFANLIDQYGKELAELTRITLGAPYEAFGKFEIALTAEVCVYLIRWMVLADLLLLIGFQI